MIVEELNDSPVETVNENGFSATVRLLVGWGDRFLLMDRILRQGGQVYPHNPLTMARARTASSAPFQGQVGTVIGSGNEMACYEKAIVTVNYVYDGQQGELFSESVEPTAEFLTIDPSGLKWSNGDRLKREEAPGRLYRGMNYVLTRHNQKFIPSSVLNLPGCVNAAPFTAALLGVTFPAETLLYQPPACQRTFSQEGTMGWTIVYRLSYRTPGWNYFWNSATGQYEQILNKNNSPYKVYPLASFNGI